VARITITQHIARDPRDVWDRLANLADHPSWMRDARSLTFTTDQHRGVGTRMEVLTRVGPFTTLDVMEVTSWEEGRAIGVSHHGLVTGSGILSVEPDGDGATVTWAEDLRFPWWLGGRVTAWLARPVLRRVWRGNLARFALLLY
jgi:hypothetical protein